jgi:hypothetical protein
VAYATANHTATAPSDYSATSGVVTFEPGVHTVMLTVPVVGDADDEPDETLSLTLSTPINATLGRATATAAIVDDDAGPVQPTRDANQDGYADLFWRHAVDGRIAVWYMNGVTQLYGIVTDPPSVTDLDWEIRAVGDLNGDWKPDLVWQHRTSGQLAAWFLDGHTCIGTTPLTALGGVTAESDLDWKIMAAADMDHDGQLDLVWQHQTTGVLRIWHMSGTFQIDSAPISLGVGTSGWRVVGAADMNGDGSADLVWRNSTVGGIATWLMADAQLLSTEWLTPDNVADLDWKIVGVRDMNQDGHADLVWQHATSGQLAAWYMNRLAVASTTNLTPASVADLNWKIVGVR